MRVFYSILIPILSICLSGCTENNKPDVTLKDIHFMNPPGMVRTQQDVFVDEPSPTIYGDWYYHGDNIFYSASLRLDSNGTYRYADSSCLGTCISIGSFKRYGPEVHLKSYPKPRIRVLSDSIWLHFRDKVFTDRDGFLYEDKKGSRNMFVHVN